jgi:ribonuclease T2
MRNKIALCVMACLLAGVEAEAKAKKSKKKPAADFDYYMLVLSYAPDFCAQAGGNKDPRECGPGRRLGFIVHGLWPQGETTRGPQNCGNASPVSAAIIQATLGYIPVDSLIQHEWRTHGSCSGMSAADYFAALRKARDAVKVPAEIDQPSAQVSITPAEAQTKLAAANPGYPKTAFRTTCYRNAELQEIRVCLDKDFRPRACGSSAGTCSAPTMTLRPVR